MCLANQKHSHVYRGCVANEKLISGVGGGGGAKFLVNVADFGPLVGLPPLGPTTWPHHFTLCCGFSASSHTAEPLLGDDAPTLKIS